MSYFELFLVRLGKNIIMLCILKNRLMKREKRLEFSWFADALKKLEIHCSYYKIILIISGFYGIIGYLFPCFHVFKASGLYNPSSAQYGFQSITKVNPSLHSQCWQGQRWKGALAGLQKYETPLNSQSITFNQSRKNWKASELWNPGSFLLPFHCPLGEN